MKRLLAVLTLLPAMLLVWANGGRRPTPPPGEDFVEEPPLLAPADEEPVEEVLGRLITLVENAVNAGDPSLLAPHLDPGFTAALPTGKRVEGFEELRTELENLRGGLKGAEYRVALHPEAIEVDGELAAARGVSEETLREAGGAETRLRIPWTMTFRKGGGAWRLFRYQGTLDPVDNPFAARRRWNTKLLYGGLGLGLGLCIGLLVGIAARSLMGRTAKPAKPSPEP